MTNEVQSRTRKINLRPDTWERFKALTETDGVSAAERLGQVVERHLLNVREGSFTPPQRRMLWELLQAELMGVNLDLSDPGRQQQALDRYWALLDLRDCFADAFDPPKRTAPRLTNWRVSA